MQSSQEQVWMGLGAHKLHSCAAELLKKMPDKSAALLCRVDAPSEDGAAQEGPSESDGLLAEEAPEADPTACATGTCDKQFWSCPGNAGFKVFHPLRLSTQILHVPIIDCFLLCTQASSAWWRVLCQCKVINST